MTQRQQCVLLRATAIFAYLWIVARAAIQSITIDEADTYLAYVAPPAPSHWSPSANNQLLNSLLMRLFTSIFGAWHLSMRAPALIGAAVYIASAYAIVRKLTGGTRAEWPLFVCLVFNPFVMDYLVAARGYSLALGLWMAAIALIVWGRGSTPNICRAASLCVGLSFAANFSFAFAGAAVMLLVLVWAWRREMAHFVKTVADCALPGLAAAFFLAGSQLLNWPRGQFVHGAATVLEMGRGILNASLFEVNPNLVNPLLRPALANAGAWIFALLGLSALLVIIVAKPKYLRWPAAFACVAGITLAAHWLLHRYLGMLLPKDRTAVFFAPLLFLIAGAAMSIPSPRLLRVPAIVALYLSAGYFLCCLRLGYFQEWQYDADVKQVYGVLSYYNRTFGAHDIFTNWRYVAALNYYRERADSDMPKLVWYQPPYSGGHEVYVMHYPTDEAFIREHCLKIVYHAQRSDVVVAIKPEIETPRRAPVASYNAAHPAPI